MIKIEKTESNLINTLKTTKDYLDFKNSGIQDKIKRERKAWELLKSNRGKYTADVLTNIFDTVDLYETNKRWFGQLLATPNRNLIFKTNIRSLNNWFEKLLFSNESLESIVKYCLVDNKIKGASNGLLTLLLYLKNPKSYNICLPKIQEGLQILGRIETFHDGEFVNYYEKFNHEVIQLRDRFGFEPQEMDWILTFIAAKVKVENGNFIIEKELISEGYEEVEEIYETKEFAYERDLRNFLAKNLNTIESGMTLYEEGEKVGIEYNAGGRFIDILALDKNKNLVVIELKVSMGYDKVIGQILRYMAWVEKNLAKEKQKVRGIIIAKDITEDLRLATYKIDDVNLYEYELSVNLNKIK